MGSNKSYVELFDSFLGMDILIVGDVMVDSYLWGRVDRISPEAPVPVVALLRRENRLGGAANVALNIKALGATPWLCSVIGDDRQGSIFSELMTHEGLDTKGMLNSNQRITTTKFRVIGNNTQMLRVDEEVLDDLRASEETELFGRISMIVDTHPIRAIIFQDYNKGVLTPGLIRKIISLAGQKGIPTCVDPKKKNFESYRNATLFKPNLKELKEGLKMDFDHNDPDQLEAAASLLQSRMDLSIVLVTLSENGVMVRHQLDNQDYATHFIAAHRRSIADVSGAGDTVISLAALCLAAGCDIRDMAALANLGGGLVCEEVGVIPVDREKLLKEVNTLL